MFGDMVDNSLPVAPCSATVQDNYYRDLRDNTHCLVAQSHRGGTRY